MYLFCDLQKAKENKSCNEKLLESYLGTTTQEEGGNMKNMEKQARMWQMLFSCTVATCILRVQYNKKCR